MTKKIELKDKVFFWDIFETWYKCCKHNVPYPQGAQCPKCVKEGKDDKSRS